MDKMDLILQKMDALDSKMDALDSKVNALDDKVNTLDNRVNALQTDVCKLWEVTNETKEELKNTRNSLEEKIHMINIRIDNELIHGVHIVADGHFDLNRKLDEVLSRDKEREKNLLRLVKVESDVELLKRHVGIA